MSNTKDENITWQVSTSEDPETGDLLLPLPEEMLSRLGWKEGDTITWEQSSEGSWVLIKK